MKAQHNDLVSNREPVVCVQDRADGFRIQILRAGFSHIELRSFFKLGVYKCNRLEQEMANPELKNLKLEA